MSGFFNWLPLSLVLIISSKIRLKRRLTLTDVLPGIGETENLLKKLNITLTEKDIILKVWIFYFNFLSRFLEIPKSSFPGSFFKYLGGVSYWYSALELQLAIKASFWLARQA